ncbi:nuclease SNase-like domain-containing protein [Rhizobium etli bv. mimosae str. IE4771]|uniref:Nuclease SNase-like domain-containing protein n=1 Tax=Rhizobium etli bv. mimosae str. IE4771 TaxID=1432050 RepID=A0A060I836_RHIET|nr:nuclease SNase-like domain-containing protein [Rhizobium sp. IE4771]
MQGPSNSKPEGAVLVLFETEHLKTSIRTALIEAALTPWQRNFLADVLARLEKYGSKTRLTDKQLAKLHQILGGESAGHGEAKQTQRMPVKARRFRHGPRPFISRKLTWWRRRLVRDIMIVAVIALVGLFYSLFEIGKTTFQGVAQTSSVASVRSNQAFTITDGDTVQVSGERAGTRLVGFNTPETFSPLCEHERQLGERASARLRELVSHGSARLTKVACACPPGTEGTSKCNHGRSCGVLKVDGRDVGQILIEEGLAVPFVCEGDRCPKTPRPWCGQRS